MPDAEPSRPATHACPIRAGPGRRRSGRRSAPWLPASSPSPPPVTISAVLAGPMRCGAVGDEAGVAQRRQHGVALGVVDRRRPGSLSVSSAMPSRSPACEPWSTDVVLSCAPAGTIGELTTDSSFSAELASTNSWVSATVPVTVPPAWPTSRVSASTSSSGVRGAEHHHRLARQRVAQDPRRHLRIEFACGIELFVERVLVVGQPVDLVLQLVSCRRADPDSSVLDSRPEPSATPMASARKTAASEIACERREIILTTTTSGDQALHPQREPVPVVDDPVEDRGVGARHPQRDDHGDQHGQHQQRDRAAGDPAAVQRGDGLGVDQLLADLEPGQERRRVALLARAVEELLDAGVVARGDDQRRAVVIAQQQRQVGGRARRPGTSSRRRRDPGCARGPWRGRRRRRAAPPGRRSAAPRRSSCRGRRR